MKATSLYSILVVLILLVFPVCTAAGQDVEPEELVQRLVDPTLKSDAARGLLDMGAKAIPALKKVLHSKRSSEYVRREILKLLPSFGAKGSQLLRAAVAEPALEYEAARQLAGLKSDKSVEGTMFGLLDKSGNPNVRLLALEWLSSKGSASKLETRLFALLSDPSGKVRQSSTALVADRLGRGAIPKLQAMLRKAELARSTSNRALRLAILKTLGAIGRKGNQEAKNVLNTLLLALNEEDERQVATDELVSIGPASVSGLLMILKAGDTRRAASAMDALLSIGQAAAPEVVDLLQARHSRMKKMAKQFLCFYQDPAVFPLLRSLYPKVTPADKGLILEIVSLYDADEPFEFLVNAAKDEDPTVRVQALRLLSRSHRKAAVPVLMSRAEEDPDLDIRLAAVRGLFTMGESSAVSSFARMVAYEKWQVRLEILQALAFMATPSDLKILSEQLRHRKSELASQAARVLANTTYLTGIRSPEEWMSDVKEITESQKGKFSPFETRTIKAGDQTVEVAFSGSGDRVILYLPSSTAHNGRYAHEYLGKLAKDYAVVILPFPGCSVGPAEQPSLAECMERYARQMDIVRQEFSDKPAVLVAHSIAGFGALAFSASHPEAVERIIWTNPVFPRRYFVEGAHRAALDSLPARWNAERELLDMQAGFLSPRARNLYRSRVELSAQVKGNGKAMLVAQGYYGLGWLLDEIFFPYDDTTMQTALASSSAPLLLMFGKDDPTHQENVAAFKKQARTAKNMVVTVLENSIRYLPVELPGAFQAAVKRFIRDYERAATVLGVGGMPTALVLTGEIGEFGGESVLLPEADTAVTRSSGELVEASRLSQFLNSRKPETLVSGERKEDDEDVAFLAMVPTDENAGAGGLSGADSGGTFAGAGDSTSTGSAGTVPAVGGSPMVSTGAEGKSNAQDIWAWSLVGFGLAGLGAGGYLHFTANSNVADANALDPLDPGVGADYDSLFDNKVADANQSMTLGYVAYGLGAASLLVGLDLLFDWPISFRKKRDSSLSVTAAPLLVREGAGFVLDIR